MSSNRHLRLAALLVALLWPFAVQAQPQQTVTPAKAIVYPVEAIAELNQLTQEEFDERYAGIDVTEIGLTDVGWYVRYIHERLVYFFGPIEERDEARRQKALLEQIRLSATLDRPKLSSSRLDVIRFDYKDLAAEDPKQPKDNPYLIPESE